MVEVVVTKLRSTVPPYDEETTTGFGEVAMLRCQMMKADNRTQLSDVDVQETLELSKPLL